MTAKRHLDTGRKCYCDYKVNGS